MAAIEYPQENPTSPLPNSGSSCNSVEQSREKENQQNFNTKNIDLFGLLCQYVESMEWPLIGYQVGAPAAPYTHSIFK